MPAGAAPAARDAAWDAHAYDRISDPQFHWGMRVVDRLDLRGDETVLDAGCGSGRLTEVLLGRLPDGRVVALDASAQMLDKARERLDPHFDQRVTYVHAALPELDLTMQVDVVFSTATFHWIPDHGRLFDKLYQNLRPDGRLCVQFGGGPILKHLRQQLDALMSIETYAAHFAGFAHPWNFASCPATEARVIGAGFTDCRVWQEQTPIHFDGPEPMKEFLAEVTLRAHVAALPAAMRDDFLHALVAPAVAVEPPWTLDFWRVNVDARKGGASRQQM